MRTLIFLLVATTVISCNRIDHTPIYYTRGCNTRPVYPYFPEQYYSLEDIDTINIRKYEDDSTFTDLISNTTFGLNDLSSVSAYWDMPPGNSIKNFSLKFGYAYEIRIVSTGQVYRLSNLPLSNKIDTFDGNSNNGHPGECWDFQEIGSITGGKYILTTYGQNPGYGGYTLELQGQ